jgi:hypothetical protein
VSSPAVARLEKLEMSGFLTLAFKVMTRLSRDCGGQSTLVDEVTRLIFCLSASPHLIALMRNRRDFPQPASSWTAVAPYRFPIYSNPLTLPKAHSQPPLILCSSFASLRLSRERGGEAFLSRFSPGTPSVFLRFWTLVLLIASTAGCTSKNIFSLNQQTTTLYTR